MNHEQRDAAALGGALPPGAAYRPVVVPRPVRIGHIIDAACRLFGVDRSDLAGRSRHRRIVAARECITVAARSVTSCSYPEIARAIGRPNHSTVITAANRFRDHPDHIYETATAPMSRTAAVASITFEAVEAAGRVSSVLR